MHKTRNTSQCKSPHDTEFYTVHYNDSQASQNLKAKYMSILAPKLITFLSKLTFRAFVPRKLGEGTLLLTAHLTTQTLGGRVKDFSQL